MRIEFEYKDLEITIYDRDEKIYVEVWTDSNSDCRAKQLETVNIVAVKGGIPGILGPDVSFNLGSMLRDARINALTSAKKEDIMVNDTDEDSIL